jgi:putative nucleotidyltransferase with HDIG domain
LASLAAAAVLSRASDWEPVGLVVLLATLAFTSDLMAIETRSLRLSGSFISLVLAMALLGPAPAVAIGALTITVDALRHRLEPRLFLSNAAAYAVFPLVGGVLMDSLGPAHHGVEFGLAVFAVFVATNGLNFLLIALPRLITHGERFRDQVRQMFIPLLPSEALAAALAVSIAVTYREVGFAPLLALVGVLFLFQVLTRELLLSQERAEQLEVRTTQLGSLQVGVLAALVQTLSLRDRHTARHSAAVARFARAIAEEIGCTPLEQELVHTAGLLHDIGKFAFPDTILLADRKLTPEDWEVVKLHPEQGARLVRRVDGYGPVADIILAHHERIDGRGYPRGLAGEEVPLLSRMISIADTYDVMTARDSYREPVAPEVAVAELRRVSGTQLDGELVEIFIRVLESESIAFAHGDDTDFERELEQERARALAVPALLEARG